MTFTFWQDITITDIKKTFCYVCFFGKNEACVECGTDKRHNPNLVTSSSLSPSFSVFP